MKNGTTTPVAPVQPKQENGNGAGKLDNLNKGSILNTEKKHGGSRKGAGRKVKAESREVSENLDILEEIRAHLTEDVEITITNRKTSEQYTEKRKTFKALLDTLRDKGLRDKDVGAIKEYFDRTLDRTFGKTAQSIGLKHSGEVGVYTAKRPTAADLAAKRAYERVLFEDGSGD